MRIPSVCYNSFDEAINGHEGSDCGKAKTGKKHNPVCKFHPFGSDCGKVKAGKKVNYSKCRQFKEKGLATLLPIDKIIGRLYRDRSVKTQVKVDITP